MKKNLFKGILMFMAMLCLSLEGRSQAAVTVVGSSTDILIEKLAAITAANASANTTASALISDAAIRRKLSDVITTMESVQAFVEMANAVTCLLVDFELTMEWAQETGYVNCAMGEDINRTMNQAMMVMDGANVAMSVFLETDPANRVFLIRDAIENFVKVQAKITVYTTYFNRLREQQASARVRRSSLKATASLSRSSVSRF